ncbi:coiled-coil domain-containing protein 82 isoform X2 [Rana temporaria]|uniref:coiled-coil domain-containing protein 82 isoform X2 n=1 Tax=Rana temporaria TaxID=8407 RepID=UPI001AAD4636|nr:coiled-coil domain-containing protein 82 isoform X2 [Rana temporaria]
MESTSRTYQTRQKRKSNEPIPKSRVDWKRTKIDAISRIVDSDESNSTSEEEEERDDSSSLSSVENEEQLEVSKCTTDDGEDTIKKPRHKNRSMTIESGDSSSDSDGPGLRVLVRRRRTIDEDDDSLNIPNDGRVSEEAKAQIKKQKRKDSLNQLVEKRRSRNPRASWESDEASSSSEYIPLTPETMGEDEDSQEMDDFIEQDEEDEVDEDGNRSMRYQELFLRHKLPQFACNDLHTHLEKVIRAFLINIVDDKFLVTLYGGKRKKRYAKEMLKSLNHLDERVLSPRLEKLITSCRWKPRYKERVNSYPKLHLRVIKAEKQSCGACELFRYCKYVVTLSGQAYDNETLENDNFLPEDKQEIDRLQMYVDAAETFQDETEESLIS